MHFMQCSIEQSADLSMLEKGKEKPDGQGRPSGFNAARALAGREGNPRFGGGQKVTRRVTASRAASFSRMELTIEDTAVATNITAIKPAIKVKVMYIISIFLFNSPAVHL
jgi:hypothetical protein